jgi:hypothetical protein
MIRVTYTPEIQRLGDPDEDVELEAPTSWDLDRAIDMCCRIDQLIKSRGHVAPDRF